MLLLLRMSVAVTVACGAAFLLGWTKTYSLHLGAIPALVFAVVAFVAMAMTRTVTTPGIRSSANPLREVLLGTGAAALWTGAMAFTFWLCGEIPVLSQVLCDRHRPAIEENIRFLENQGQYEAAAAVGLKELSTPHTPEWTRTLAEWTMRLLCRAAEGVEADKAKVFIDQALELAHRYELPDDLPRLLSEQLQGRLKSDKEKRAHDEAEVKLKEAAALQKKATEELNAAEKKIVAGDAAREKLEQQLLAAGTYRQGALSESLRLLCVGVHEGTTGNLAGVDAALSEAIILAGRNNLPFDDLQALRSRVQAWIVGSRPAELEAGVTGRILRSQMAGAQGLQFVDVDLRYANRAPLTGLVDKDFIASQKERRLRLAAYPRRLASHLNVAIAIDTSISTEGAPLHGAQAGVATLLGALPENVKIRATAFSDGVRLLTDWSMDVTAAMDASRKLTAEGGTALFVALEDAISSVSRVSGEKIVVVFSDGANSVPGPSKESLIASARRHHIAVQFVALKQNGHDTEAIEEIAGATGGQTIFVQDAGELISGFRTLAAGLVEEGYRLVLLNYDAAEPLSLHIGSTNPIELSLASSIAAQ